MCALAWTVFAVYGSLVPFNYQRTTVADALERFRNLPPLFFGEGSRADWATNVLLFIPLTFLWMGAFVCDRRRAARITAAALLVPVAAVVSVAIEFTQIWFPGRTTSRDDIVAESVGGVIGVLIWLGIGQRVVGWLRGYFGEGRQSQHSQLQWLLQAYLLGFVIVSVLPLDLTISLTELYHKWERGQVLLIPFGFHYESVSVLLYESVTDVLVFVPVGAWVALTQQHRARTLSPLMVGTVGGGLIAAMIEFAQLLVLSRYTDVTDVILGTVGSAIGAWLVVLAGKHSIPRPNTGIASSRFRAALPWLAAIAGYSLFLMAGFWFPFEVTHDRAVLRSRLSDFLYRLPFLSLYLGTEFNAVNQLLIRVLLFAPLGVMWAYLASLARTPNGRRVVSFGGLVYATMLAFGIEAVEVLMPSKIADLTEVLFCALGALGGLYAALRLFKPAGHPKR